MIDLPFHLLLFAAIGVCIVMLGTFYGEPDDRKALRSLPRRFAMFVLGCSILAGLLILAQHTVARVS